MESPLTEDEHESLRDFGRKVLQEAFVVGRAKVLGFFIVLAVLIIYGVVIIYEFNLYEEDSVRRVQFSNVVLWGDHTPGILNVAVNWSLGLIITAIVVGAIKRIVAVAVHKGSVLRKALRLARREAAHHHLD